MRLEKEIKLNDQARKRVEERMQRFKQQIEAELEQPDPAPKNFVRLFCDYSANPIWTETGMMEYEQLPVSEALKIALRAWELHYDFNDNKNYSGQFSCPGELAAHDRVGREIAVEVKRQLPHWIVIYVPNTNCGEPFEVFV